MNTNWTPENEAQYRNTKKWRDKFIDNSLEYMQADIDPILKKACVDAAHSTAETLTEQMKRYEAIHGIPEGI